MKDSPTFVLLGKIPKGDEARTQFTDWKEEYVRLIEDQIPKARFLHGDLITDDVGSELVVGHDLWLIKNADVIIVDARAKIGAGTAQEMVIAKQYQKPVVSVIPPDTHHRKSNVLFSGSMVEDWVHPFLYLSSDYVASDIPEAVEWARGYLSGDTEREVKDVSVFEKAISRFEAELPEMVKKYRDNK